MKGFLAPRFILHLLTPQDLLNVCVWLENEMQLKWNWFKKCRRGWNENTRQLFIIVFLVPLLNSFDILLETLETRISTKKTVEEFMRYNTYEHVSPNKELI